MTVLIALSCLAILFAHVWVHAAPKDVTMRIIPSAERAAYACVSGYWLPRHVYVWHMHIEGYGIFLFQI